jgi:MFS family permease
MLNDSITASRFKPRRGRDPRLDRARRHHPCGDAGATIAAIGGAARAAAIDVWTLYAAAIVSGFGVAIMQPGMPTRVRERLPSRLALGGMLMGAMFPAVLACPPSAGVVGLTWCCGGSGAVDRSGLFVGQPKDPRGCGKASGWRPPRVAGLKKSTGLAARLYLREQQQPVFRRQRLSRRLSGDAWHAGTARRGARLAQRFAGLWYPDRCY